MKSILFILLSLTLSLQAGAKSPFKKGYDILKPETIKLLQERRELLRSWMPDCQDGSLTMSDCPFWDAAEYMGMMCLSGEERYCEQVKNAQDAQTGRWFRSPGFKLTPDAHPNEETFSRDMLRGVFGYVIATQDRAALLKFMNYIEGNFNRICPKPMDGKWDACKLRLGSWTFFTEVYDWLGLERTQKMKNFKFLLASLYEPLQTKVQPKTYQMILTVESIYMRQKMQEMGYKLRNPGTNHHVAKIIYKRVPENGFYEYLYKGPTESAAAKILKMCPTIQPVVGLTAAGNPQYTEPANGPWEQGSGHYCVFMINVLLGSAK